MQGFLDGVPLTVAVAWLKNADGTFVETPLLDGQPFDFGLLAYTTDGTTVTRWFVPWSSVVYIKQPQPVQAPGPAPTPAKAPAAPPVDKGP